MAGNGRTREGKIRKMEEKGRERQERIEIEKQKLQIELKMKELELQGKSKTKSLPLDTSKSFDVTKHNSFLHFKKKRLINISYILRRCKKT